MGEEQRIDPGHDDVRRALRVIGPAVALVGLGFIAAGMISFFSAFGTFEPPRYFWCLFVGMPLLAVGLGIVRFAYMGSVFRYLMGETAPVQKDTFNYLARGTSPGVQDLARAVSRGIAEGARGPGRGGVEAFCPKCGAENAASANYCGHCGTLLARGEVPPDR